MKISLNRVKDSQNAEYTFSYDLNVSGLECTFDHPFYKPVSVSGRLFENAGGYVLSMSVDAPVATVCARCAKELQFVHHTDTLNVISEKKPGNDTEDDVVFAENGEIDVDEIVKEALLLSMDMVYLCSEDCKGLCPGCGADLNVEPCTCKKEIDPRLIKLKEFLEK